MSISQFATYMNPLIFSLKKLGGSARPDEVCNVIAEDLKISQEVLEAKIKSGASRFENQVHWARYYLVKTGYIDSSKRGVWSLTEKGQNTQKLSEAELRKIIQGVQTIISSVSGSGNDVSDPKEFEAPRLKEIHNEGPYRKTLLDILQSLPPSGFERLCQRLLREAGFEKVTVTGRSGDGGIDGYGILQVNPLVSFTVLFQCKRYEGSVSASQVRDFRGAMVGRAEKGIVLTTGTFTSEAKKEAIRDGVAPIELVDGEKLITMFEQLELGLVSKKTFDIDIDFFNTFR